MSYAGITNKTLMLQEEGSRQPEDGQLWLKHVAVLIFNSTFKVK
jgi:hypothetical protein